MEKALAHFGLQYTYQLKRKRIHQAHQGVYSPHYGLARLGLSQEDNGKKYPNKFIWWVLLDGTRFWINGKHVRK